MTCLIAFIAGSLATLAVGLVALAVLRRLNFADGEDGSISECWRYFTGSDWNTKGMRE